MVDRARCKWTSRSAVEVIIESERFIVVCSSCRENFKFGNFTLSLGRLRQRIVLKCVPHVQHDYFSSFNQSHCFLASSLSLPSSSLKLANTQRRRGILKRGRVGAEDNVAKSGNTPWLIRARSVGTAGKSLVRNHTA